MMADRTASDVCRDPRSLRQSGQHGTNRRRLLAGVIPGALLFPRSRRAVARAEDPPPAEGRALWVNRFEYGDAEDIARIMERAAFARFNIVYFQVRGAGDAFYRSEIEPCAVGLCGRLGGEPPYDALETAVAEGAKHGLAVHAWLNALSGWGSGSDESCALLTQPEGERPRHLLLDHPEWAVHDERGEPQPCPNQEEYVFLSPVHRGVRSRLAKVTADVARRYPVRGIHLDRIRYPGRAWSYDPVSLEAFGRDPADDPGGWDDFRRKQVDKTVRETFEAMAGVDPTLALSASVWLIYRDRWDWGTDEGYSTYFQDARAWTKAGYLDVAVPMTYEPLEAERCARADWDCLVADHIEAIQQGHDRHVYAGIAAWHGAEEIERAIAIGRGHGVAGFSLYSFSQIDKRDLWSFFADGPFKRPAEIPPQPWKRITLATPEVSATPATPATPANGDGSGGPEMDGTPAAPRTT